MPDDDLFSPKDNCCEFFEQAILKDMAVPLILKLDKIDLIFPYSNTAEEFLSLLRLWHETAKTKDTWGKLRLVIAHSTEFYVKMVANHPPFNVGTIINFSDD